MSEIIIIKEQGVFPDGTREERINELEKRKKHILKLIPKIVQHFKDSFGMDLIKIDVTERGVHYGHESHSMKIPEIEFYFNDINYKEIEKYKREVKKEIKFLFNIEFEYYGVPISLKFFKLTWKEI